MHRMVDIWGNMYGKQTQFKQDAHERERKEIVVIYVKNNTRSVNMTGRQDNQMCKTSHVENDTYLQDIFWTDETLITLPEKQNNLSKQANKRTKGESNIRREDGGIIGEQT